jgi:16S rRNA (cytosine1402-N4)-methyltransferase
MVFHRPVMVEELMGCLAPHPGGIYLDATVGGGGHAAEVLERSGPDGRLIGLDVDSEALEEAAGALAGFGDRFRLFHRSYADLSSALAEVAWGTPNGIYFDLGVSSRQIDSAARGFSFQVDGPLDMRMDRDSAVTAADLVNSLDGEDLKSLLSEYGEEPRAGLIARAVMRRRLSGPIERTAELAELIGRETGAGVKTLARVFQALRIEVNSELDNISRGLEAALDSLPVGGVMAVISYHSLEDRPVKEFFRGWEKGCICPPDWPECRCGRTPRLVRPFKRPLRPTDVEIRANPRARSARLRAAEKL